MSRKRYPRLFGFLALLSTLALSGCGMSVLDPKGQIGIDEKNLIITATLMMLLVVVPVIVMTFWFAWRYRASNTNATYAPSWAHSHKIEAIVWGVPTIIVVALGILIWESSHELDPYKPLESDIKPVTIEVVMIDWKWLFIYPDQGIATVNEIKFPANVPVNFRITSDATMGSFFIPGLGGQIYAMAGMETKLHLISNENHVYNGVAANLTGEGFSDQNFKAYATSQADFDAWVAAAKKAPNQLDLTQFNELAKPSVKHPVEYFATVQPNLFQTIIDKYEGMNKGTGMKHEAGEANEMTGMDMTKHSAAGAEE
ncbi:MAG: Cytochrome o subunit [Pseudomonas sp.]|jgi:cytochrome o ubiquinol oxidase subunit 2|uniref:ubiquinol oxidase subunit II n=1 Tax=Pseudomonas sp. TaxID=306 RepID=UPI00262F5D72|nr:ubiquinol oxidase subunit II [Pseudomonas sp.]MDB6048975.1 Cytochrome o subunit [Pseudomonas sp.]